MPADGRHAPSRAGIPGTGREFRAGRAVRPGGAVDGPAQLRAVRAGSRPHVGAACFRRRHFARALPDSSYSSRPSAIATISSPPATNEDAHAEPPPNAVRLDEFRPAAGRAGRCGRPGENPLAGRGVRRARGGGTRSSRRYRHRHAGAAAGRRGGVAQRAIGQAAEQPQPGAGLGAREHRPDHSYRSGGFHC